MSNKPNTKEEYSFDRKKKLAARISDMRDKDVLRKIRDIIFAENPEVSARKSSNGYLMYFQNYNNETYYKIEKFLNKVERDKIERQTKSITEISENMLMSSEQDDPNTDYTVSRTRLRYSNREKRLIKRRQYENIINEKIMSSDESEDNDETSDNNETENSVVTKNKKDPNNPIVKTKDKADIKSSPKVTKTMTSSKATNVKPTTRTKVVLKGSKNKKPTTKTDDAQQPIVKNTAKSSVKPKVSKKKQESTIFSKVGV